MSDFKYKPLEEHILKTAKVDTTMSSVRLETLKPLYDYTCKTYQEASFEYGKGLKSFLDEDPDSLLEDHELEYDDIYDSDGIDTKYVGFILEGTFLFVPTNKPGIYNLFYDSTNFISVCRPRDVDVKQATFIQGDFTILVNLSEEYFGYIDRYECYYYNYCDLAML